MKTISADDQPGNSAADKLALLEKQEELREKRNNEEKERLATIASLDKAANEAQNRDAAVLEANKIKGLVSDATRVRKVLANLIEIPLFWNDENGERPLVCGLLFADFTSGTLQYSNKKPIEISCAIKPIKMLRLLMEQQPRIVTYTQLAKTLGFLTKQERETKIADDVDINIAMHKRYGRQIQDIRGELLIVLREAGLRDKEIENLIVAKSKQGFTLRCS